MTTTVQTTTGEEIAGAMLSTLALSKRPIGTLTEREREIIGREWTYRNRQARKRIEEQDADRLFPMVHCPVHRTRMIEKTGDRKRDCFYCRVEAENQAVRDYMQWKDDSRQWDDFRQEEGMMAATGHDTDDTLTPEQYAAWNSWLWESAVCGLLITVCVILVAGILMAGGGR